MIFLPKPSKLGLILIFNKSVCLFAVAVIKWSGRSRIDSDSEWPCIDIILHYTTNQLKSNQNIKIKLKSVKMFQSDWLSEPETSTQHTDISDSIVTFET